MSFTTHTSSQPMVLAQNFNTGGTGSGGVDDVVGALDNLTGVLITIGSSVAVIAFIVAILRVFVTMKGGGSFGQAFSGIGMALLFALLLGVGTAAVGWAIGIGDSLV